MLAASLAAPAAAQPAGPPQNACFEIEQFQNWRAPDDRTIYIRVLFDKYYRLDLAGTCPALRMPDSHLITHTRGPDTVCSAIDWDLKVSEGPSFRFSEPCIVKTMTLLGPAEVAAIPKGFKP
jgi:hypothetical protein